jgi:hypothetical protein
VTVGEQPQQDHLEDVALADHGSLDLRDDLVGELADLDVRERHRESSSTATTIFVTSSMAMPGPNRSSGGT